MTNIIMLSIVVCFWFFTMITFTETVSRRRYVVEHNTGGDMLMFMNQYVRHEGLRLSKHSIIVFLVGMSVVNPEWPWRYFNDPMIPRNFGVTLIGFLMGVNSVLDLIVRRRRLRAFDKGTALH